MAPSLGNVQPAPGRVSEAGGKGEVPSHLRRGQAGRGQIDAPQASGRAAFHEVALPVGGCPAFGAIGDDERVRVDEEASGRGAKRLSPGVGDRFARVRSFKDEDAAPVETNRQAIGRTGRDKGHRLFEGAWRRSQRESFPAA